LYARIDWRWPVSAARMPASSAAITLVIEVRIQLRVERLAGLR